MPISLGQGDDLSREGSKKNGALKKNRDGNAVGLVT